LDFWGVLPGCARFPLALGRPQPAPVNQANSAGGGALGVPNIEKKKKKITKKIAQQWWYKKKHNIGIRV
jgi:hypothetical protein